MLDPQVTDLLESAINTSCKLAIILDFLDRRHRYIEPVQMSERLGRDIWSIEESLQELVEAGILVKEDNCYWYEPSLQRRTQLQALRQTYDHPLQRAELHRVLHDLERYAPYMKELPPVFLHSRIV